MTRYPRDKYRTHFIDFVLSKIKDSALPEETPNLYNAIQTTLYALEGDIYTYLTLRGKTDITKKDIYEAFYRIISSREKKLL